jgi:hypothetical protein
LLRDVPADGEAVLSQRARALEAIARPSKGLPPADPSTDLLSFLKRSAKHELTTAKRTDNEDRTAASPGAGVGTGSAPRAPRWNDALPGAEPALRAAWRVNFVDLDFRAVTVISLASSLALCVFVAAVLPPANRRTRQTDALEFALITLLTVMFSPLSFNYAYVWLIYPMTLALHLVISEPAGAPRHRLKIAWIMTVASIPALAVPMPILAQAYGNLFLPALLLVIGLGAMLHSAGRRNHDLKLLARQLHLVECGAGFALLP